MWAHLALYSAAMTALPGYAIANCTTAGTDTTCTGTFSVTSAAPAVDLNSAGTVNLNVGTGASVANALGDGIVATQSTSGTVNSQIFGTVASGAANALTIINNGTTNVTIGAGGSLSGDIGLRLQTLDPAISNVTVAGTVASINGDFGRAIEMGAGSNTLTLATGASITGLVISNAGTGTLALTGTGTTSNTFAGFSNLVARADGTWTFSGLLAGDPVTASVERGRLIYNGAVDLGATTVFAGATLQVGTAATAGMVAAPITNNGTVEFRRSDTVNFGNSISGTGAVVQSGPGSLILTGANTYSGGTTITGGSLQIGNGGTTGSLAGNITNNAQLTFNRSNLLQFDGAISGTGRLTQAGSGTLVLTGANTYTGGTTISAGTLQIGNGGASGSLSGDIANSGMLAINRSDSFGLDGLITGTGGLTQLGTGTLTLSGANSFSGGTFLNAGTLALANNLALGTGTLSVNGNRSLVAATGNLSLANPIVLNGALGVNPAGQTMTLAGPVSGVGFGLAQTGAGNLILSGMNTYTGATSVDAGRLAVNGSIASSSGVTVATGAEIGGTGTVSSLVVNGTLAPGNSIGTLAVQGNLTLGSAATTVIELGSTTADRINVTGRATLAGALQLVANSWPYTFYSPYTILSAQGGAVGTFGNIQTQGSFGPAIRTSLAYSGTDVTVTLAPNALMPILGTTALTANQRAVATSFDRAVMAGGDPSAYLPLLNQPIAALPASINLLSGEVHTAARGMGIAASNQFLQTMLSYGFNRNIPMQDAAPVPGEKGAPRSAPAPMASDNAFTLWGSTFAQKSRVDGSAPGTGAAKQSASDGHMAFGANLNLFETTVAGIAVSTGRASATLGNGLGSAKADVFQVGAHASTTIDDLSLGFAGSLSSLSTTTDRAIPILGQNSIKAKYDSLAWSGRTEIAYAAVHFSDLRLSPFAALQAQTVRTPSFVETGAGGTSIGVSAASQSQTTARTELGARLDAAIPLNAASLRVFARLGWAHYLENDVAFTAGIVGLANSSFTIMGARPARDAALVSLGAETNINQSLSIGGRLDSEASASNRRFGGSARINVMF